MSKTLDKKGRYLDCVVGAVIKGSNPQQLLQLSMHDFPFMLQVKLPVVDGLHTQSNKVVTGVENKATEKT